MPIAPPTARSALRVAGIYVAFGLVWVLSTDLIVHSGLVELSDRFGLELLKSFVFVLLSALIIFLLVRRELMLRRQAQDLAANELARRDAYLRTVVESVSDIIAVVGANSLLRFHSQSTEDILGYSENELVGEDVLSLIHPEDQPTAAEAIGNVFSGSAERPQVVSVRFRHRDGSWRHLEAIGALLGEPGSAEAQIILTARDISDRIAAETALAQSEAQLRQAQRMEAVGRLAGGIAHDFNNLVTAILGYVHVLSDALQQQPELLDDLSEIRAAADRARTLTDQLLTFSRQEVRRPRRVDVGDLIRRLDKLLRGVIGEDVRLHTFVGTHAGPVYIDPGQLEQVVLNLAVNARDAMPRGGELRITVERVVTVDRAARKPQDLAPPFVRLEIEDTGVGMSDDTAGHVFEPFFTTKKNGISTGLGLSIVYGIVNQAQGRVTLASRPDHGTTVRVDLPLAPGDDRPPEHVTAPHRSLESLGGSATVLVVEDEDSVRRLCHRLLSRLGYNVFEASDGKQALEVCERENHAIDLLLTDVVMPDLDGGQLIETALQTCPTIRVIVMSGYTDDTVVRHGIEKGTYHFLAKPFTPLSLAQAVSEVLAEPRIIQ